LTHFSTDRPDIVDAGKSSTDTSRDSQNGLPKGPLNGIRVLDLSRILAGPSCTQLLGDYGADIVKVEKPGAGDDTRKWGPPYVRDDEGNDTTESAYYLCANRNKRSVAIDISSEQGARIIRKLAEKCDIFIENFKLDGLKKFGLDYESLKKHNPALIYCSITGFGQTGPNAHLPGYDIMAQGYGGIMSLTGAADGEPMKVAVGVADVVCGLYAATAILAAIRHRDLTSEGQYIDIALVDTQISWLVNEGANYLASGNVPKRRGNEHPNIVPYQVFEARDGYVIVAVGNDGQFARFCSILGRDDLAKNPNYSINEKRVENRQVLIELLRTEIAKFGKNDLLEQMGQNNVPSGPINNLEEVFSSEQVAARDMRISIDHPLAQSGTVELIGNPVKFSKTPVTYRRAPPVCGEHTSEVMDEWLPDIEGKN
jgi:crotonobetainyl-CoA:carnitine CoA-transferase CaiB-like acyl-CoA transferase